MSCQQRRYFAFPHSATTVRVMKKDEGKESRKAKLLPEHTEEAKRLLALWTARPHGTQDEFGEEYKIGNQSAVRQFLYGLTPLSLKAAAGFARGLGCTISDFSPRLAQEAAEMGRFAGLKLEEAPPATVLQLNEFATGLSRTMFNLINAAVDPETVRKTIRPSLEESAARPEGVGPMGSLFAQSMLDLLGQASPTPASPGAPARKQSRARPNPGAGTQ
jgi:hypothetical protein